MALPGDPFESAAPYYADHRPGYCDAVIEHVVERFDLDGSARVLDLGCGTGEIAVPLAAHSGEVVGMDPSRPMLVQARQCAAAAGRENVAWILGSDATLPAVGGPFRLTTVGRAFHRMDRRATLDRLSALTEPNGGVALLGDPEWLARGTADWQDAVYEVFAAYVDDPPRRTGPVEYDEPYHELLADCGYRDVEVAEFPFEREWDAGGVVGYLLSLSFCSPAVLGDDQEAFEADVRVRMAEFTEPVVQTGAMEVVSGRIPAGHS